MGLFGPEPKLKTENAGKKDIKCGEHCVGHKRRL
jgi:hypothetical protein